MTITHRATKSRAYTSWRGMVERCTNPRNSHYHVYGGRGIVVCPRWRVFENFFADMGERPDGHSLDRIDNGGNYEPSNCRWATANEQQRNTERNVWIEWNGQRKVMKDWAAEMGITGCALSFRIERWGLDAAMSAGKKKNGTQKLTDQQVLLARRARAEKGYRYGGMQMAESFGVTPGALHGAVRGSSFKHLPSWESMVGTHG